MYVSVLCVFEFSSLEVIPRLYKFLSGNNFFFMKGRKGKVVHKLIFSHRKFFTKSTDFQEGNSGSVSGASILFRFESSLCQLLY